MTERKYDELRAIAGDVSRETFEKLLSFESLFLHWAQRINLASPATLEDIWRRHILDSAQLLPLASGALRWADLGSGGGFPGAVIAVLMADADPFRIHLVESNAKKAAFLQNAVGALGGRAKVVRARIEDAAATVGPVDIVSARALAPLGTLLALASPWLEAPGTKALFHKGRGYEAEVEESHDRWQYDLVIHADRIDPQGRILEIANLRGSGAKAQRGKA